jgi:hypothetical protein
MFRPGGKLNRLGGFLERPRAFDSVYVVLATGLLVGAYVTAYAYVQIPNTVLQGPNVAGLFTVNISWSLLTLFLFAAYASGLRSGRSWNQALPDGYTGSLAAALVFGAAWLSGDTIWSPVFGDKAVGLESLFSPPHLIEVAAAAVIVSGPLRAATRRGDVQAGLATVLSAALFMSVLTFATQFIHPLIDPWAAGDYPYRPQVFTWLGENIGVASILVQATILAVTGLLLNSGFKLRPGSLTLVFTLNGILVTLTKSNFKYVPILVATGIAADLWVAWTARRPGKPSASLCAVIGGSFSIAYMLEISLLPAGTSWGASLWSGTIIAATMLCWIMGRVLRAGLPQTVTSAGTTTAPSTTGDSSQERWTLDPESAVREQIVRAALDDLGTPEALGRNPLGRLPGLSKGLSAAADLRAALVDVIGDIARSASPRDAEAGRLLLDYYVKKAGSHEVIMERLHMSRPTYYRRLHHGFRLVADRLDELSEFAQRTPVQS